MKVSPSQLDVSILDLHDRTDIDQVQRRWLADTVDRREHQDAKHQLEKHRIAVQVTTGFSTVQCGAVIVDLIDTLREGRIVEEMRLEDDRRGIETTHLFDTLLDEPSTGGRREMTEIFIVVVESSSGRGESAHEVLDGVKLKAFLEGQGELMGKIARSDVHLTILVVAMDQIGEKNPLFGGQTRLVVTKIQRS